MNLGELLVEMGFTVDRSSLSEAENVLKRIKSTAVKLLGAIGIGFSIKQLNAVADQYNAINDKIANIVKDQEKAKVAQRDILATSKSLHKSYAEVTSQVESLMKSGKATTVQDALKQITKEAGTSTVTIKDYIQSMKDEFGLWVADLWTSMDVANQIGGVMERLFKLVMTHLNKLRPTIERLFRLAVSGLNKAVTLVERAVRFIDRVVDRLGGVETVISLIGSALGLIVGLNLISKVQKLLSILNPVTLVLGALVLLIQDFYVFMVGGKSTIGRVFEALGVDADDARKNIKEFIEDLGKKIKEVFEYCTKHKKEISTMLVFAMTMILIIIGLLNPIPAMIAIIAFEVLVIAGNWDKVKESAHDAFEGIAKWATKTKEFLQPVLDILTGIREFFEEGPVGWTMNSLFGEESTKWLNMAPDDKLPKEFRDKKKQGGFVNKKSKLLGNVLSDNGQALQEFAGQAEEEGKSTIDGYTSGVLDGIKDLADAFKEAAQSGKDILGHSTPSEGPMAGDDQWMPDMMKTFAEGIRGNIPLVKGAVDATANMIRDTFKRVLDPSVAMQWGTDFMAGLANGINEGSAIVQARVQEVAEGMSAPLHFSAPDEGPLADYESWMPDFMQGLANGIAANAGVVLEQLRSLTGDMEGIIGAEMANIGSLTAALSSSVNNISQSVRITNQFSGDRAAQLQGAKAMDKSAKDATAYMADALRFGR